MCHCLGRPLVQYSLLAPQGHTIPNGHTNVEIYGMGAFTDGQYSAEGRRIDTRSFVAALLIQLLLMAILIGLMCN